MDYLKGKGAQLNTSNPFSRQHLSFEHDEGIDEAYMPTSPRVSLQLEHPKRIISRNKSEDLAFDASVNPYQGCEHGCAYCYARITHEYWGYSAGLDFETKIIAKPNAAKLLEQEFLKRSWRPKTIILSGNTDCYQPMERRLGITREVLNVFRKYQNPVGIITKNALVTRDIDILGDLAKQNLTYVILSITSLDEGLRQKLEPRTATSQKKLEAIRQLKEAGIPVGVMIAPVIPGLNQSEIPKILERAAENGATFASYTVVRLNGSIGAIFQDWLKRNYPDRAEKVWHQVADLHGGAVHDSDFSSRLKGTGHFSDAIKSLFVVSRRKFMGKGKFPKLSTQHFRAGGNYSLFQ